MLKVDAIRRWLSLVLALAVAILGYCEYQDRKKQWRVEKTLSFAKRSNSSEILATRKIIAKTWYDNTNSLKNNVKNYDLEIISIVYKNYLNLDLLSMLSFYEEFVICVKNEICSDIIALEMFGTQIISFYNQWKPYFNWNIKKTNNKKLLYNIDKFIEVYKAYQGGSDPKAYIHVLNSWRMRIEIENSRNEKY